MDLILFLVGTVIVLAIGTGWSMQVPRARRIVMAVGDAISTWLRL